MVTGPADLFSVQGQIPTRCVDVVRALTHAISVIRSGTHDPLEAHARVKGMYDWASVAERTERVYERVMASEERDLGERLARYVAGSSPPPSVWLCAMKEADARPIHAQWALR